MEPIFLQVLTADKYLASRIALPLLGIPLLALLETLGFDFISTRPVALVGSKRDQSVAVDDSQTPPRVQ